MDDRGQSGNYGPSGEGGPPIRRRGLTGPVGGKVKPAKPPADKKQVRLGCGILLVIAALVGWGVDALVSGGGSPAPSPHPTTAATTSTAAAVQSSAPAALTGTAALLASAGPLPAHIVDGNEVVCDSTTATYVSDGSGGVRVIVDFPGSGLLNINATSINGAADTSQEYTEGTNETGHTFDLSGLAPSNVQEIYLGVTTPEGGGDCQVSKS